jgi:hypothetical protein
LWHILSKYHQAPSEHADAAASEAAADAGSITAVASSALATISVSELNDTE